MANISYNAISGGSKVLIRTLGNSGDVQVIGNNSVSNLTSNATETVVGATISKAIYGCPGNSYWAVYRGANLAAVLTGSGTMDYALTGDPTANITANLIGGSVGVLVLEVSKKSSF